MINFNQALQQLVDKLTGWVQAAIVSLPNLVIAVLVFVLFYFGARLASKVLGKALSRVSHNRQVNGLITTMVYTAVIVVGAMTALGILNLTGVVTSLLAGVGIIGLALGFAFQDLAANFMAGILIAIRQPFEIDDVVETNDFVGTVEKVSLRSTSLRSFQGQIVLVPNKDIFGNPIVNYSVTGKRRVDLSCGVAYGDDLEKARDLAIRAVKSIEYLDSSKEVQLFYTEFGDSSINFDIRFWINFRKQVDYLRAQSDAIMKIKRSFDDNGITIPFPIRTLDFGVVGGEKLAEALPPKLRG